MIGDWLMMREPSVYRGALLPLLKPPPPWGRGVNWRDVGITMFTVG